MYLGISQAINRKIQEKHVIKLDLTLEALLKDYESLFNQSKKHKGIISHDTLNNLGITEYISLATSENIEFIADNLGRAITLYADPVNSENKHESYGIVGNVITRNPFEITEKGLEYEIAVLPSYKLLDQKNQTCTSYKMLESERVSRHFLPEETLDGAVSIYTAPLSIAHGSLPASRNICPFLFTDFEHEDKETRKKFRDVTSAGLIGLMIGGYEVSQDLMYAIQKEHNCENKYNKWFDFVSEQTPYQDLISLQEKYPDINLTQLVKNSHVWSK